MKENRKFQPDLVRTVMILIVFLGHAIPYAYPHSAISTLFSSLSPGMTMSLLAFLSAQLLSFDSMDSGTFLIKRGLRIYIPLWTSMTCILLLSFFMPGELAGKEAHPDTILHLMGLTAFGYLFEGVNDSVIGLGLWFITAIFGLYLTLPALTVLLKHKNASVHLILIIVASMCAHTLIYESESLWNVVIGFCVGLYFRLNPGMCNVISPNKIIDSAKQKITYIACAMIFLSILVACTMNVYFFEKSFRDILFPIYPLMMIPLFTWWSQAKMWSPFAQKGVSYFSKISFEFYLVHFYFINGRFNDASDVSGIILGLAISLIMADILFRVNQKIASASEAYLIGNRMNQGIKV